MKTLEPYLVFTGACREALNFYAEVFQGQISKMKTFAEAPFEVPESHLSHIFDSELRIDGLVIRASDNLPGFETHNGSNISLFITFEDGSVRKKAFELLAEGGKVLFPLDDQFGMLRDQYGVQWMFA